MKEAGYGSRRVHSALPSMISMMPNATRTRRSRGPLVVLVLACAIVPFGSAQQAAPAGVQGQALEQAPESRMEAAQSLDAAIAAALIGAIAKQFGERRVEVKLDDVKSAPVNLIDLQVAGDGRLRIGEDEEWLPVKFEGLYDSMAAVVVQPRLTVGDAGDGVEVPLDSAMAAGLQAEAARRVQAEFALQPVSLRLDRVREVATGKRYARLEANGAVDFAEQGSSVATVNALYDRQSNEWLQLHYELSSAASEP